MMQKHALEMNMSCLIKEKKCVMMLQSDDFVFIFSIDSISGAGDLLCCLQPRTRPKDSSELSALIVLQQLSESCVHVFFFVWVAFFVQQTCSSNSFPLGANSAFICYSISKGIECMLEQKDVHAFDVSWWQLSAWHEFQKNRQTWSPTLSKISIWVLWWSPVGYWTQAETWCSHIAFGFLRSCLMELKLDIQILLQQLEIFLWPSSLWCRHGWLTPQAHAQNLVLSFHTHCIGMISLHIKNMRHCTSFHFNSSETDDALVDNQMAKLIQQLTVQSKKCAMQSTRLSSLVIKGLPFLEWWLHIVNFVLLCGSCVLLIPASCSSDLIYSWASTGKLCHRVDLISSKWIFLFTFFFSFWTPQVKEA